MAETNRTWVNVCRDTSLLFTNPLCIPVWECLPVLWLFSQLCRGVRLAIDCYIYRCMNLFHLPVLSLHKLHGGRPGSSLAQMTERMCTGPHSVVSAAHSCITTGIQLEKTVSRKETERYKMHILWHDYNTRISCLWEMCMCPHMYLVRCDPCKHNYIDTNEEKVICKVRQSSFDYHKACWRPVDVRQACFDHHKASWKPAQDCHAILTTTMPVESLWSFSKPDLTTMLPVEGL